MTTGWATPRYVSVARSSSLRYPCHRARAHLRRCSFFPRTQSDDYLHNPDPKRDLKHDKGGSIFTLRGLQNLGCLAVLVLALFGLCASSSSTSPLATSSTASARADELRSCVCSRWLPDREVLQDCCRAKDAGSVQVSRVSRLTCSREGRSSPSCPSPPSSLSLGGINSTGQVPAVIGGEPLLSFLLSRPLDD